MGMFQGIIYTCDCCERKKKMKAGQEKNIIADELWQRVVVERRSLHAGVSSVKGVEYFLCQNCANRFADVLKKFLDPPREA